MKRTSITVLLLLALAGAAVGFLLNHALTAGGRPTFTPVLGLPLLLVVLSASVLMLGWTVRRGIRNPAKHRRVNPFRALRIAILAKASSLVAALIAGVSVGAMAYLFTRPVEPPVGSTLALVSTLGAAIILAAAALIAEHFCTLPSGPDDATESGSMKDDDDEYSGSAGHPAH